MRSFAATGERLRVLAGQNAALAEAVEVIDSGQNAILAIEEVVDARLRAIGRRMRPWRRQRRFLDTSSRPTSMLLSSICEMLMVMTRVRGCESGAVAMTES